MGTLSSLFELHHSTQGWSTLALLALTLAILIVGGKVMLGVAHESWVSHNIVVVCMVAALVQLGLFAAFMYASYSFFGLAWIGAPLGALAMLALVFALERLGLLSRGKPGA